MEHLQVPAWGWWVLAAILLVVWLSKRGNKITCPYCKHEGRTIKRAKASGVVQVILFILTLGGLFIMVLPGLVFGVILLIYSLSGYKHQCRKCKMVIGA